jgi:hypothetical protein
MSDIGAIGWIFIITIFAALVAVGYVGRGKRPDGLTLDEAIAWEKEHAKK